MQRVVVGITNSPASLPDACVPKTPRGESRDGFGLKQHGRNKPVAKKEKVEDASE